MQRNERGVAVLAPYVVLVQWQQQWAAKSWTKSAAEVIKHHQFNQHCRRPTWAIQEGRWSNLDKVKLPSEPCHVRQGGGAVQGVGLQVIKGGNFKTNPPDPHMERGRPPFVALEYVIRALMTADTFLHTQ